MVVFFVLVLYNTSAYLYWNEQLTFVSELIYLISLIKSIWNFVLHPCLDILFKTSFAEVG